MVSPSAATTALVSVQTKLKDEVQPSLQKAHDPLSKAVAQFRKVEEQLRNAENGITTIEKFNKDLKAIVTMTGRLGGFVPAIGQALKIFAEGINKSKIMEAIGEVIERLKTTMIKIRTKIWGRVNKAFTNLNKALEDAQKKATGCTEALQAIVSFFQVVDAAVAAAPTGSIDVANPVSNPTIVLGTVAKEWTTNISELSTALSPLAEQIKNTWSSLDSDMLKTLSDMSLSIKNKLDSVTKVMAPLAAACNRIQDVLKPFMNFLDKAKWLFNKIVDPVLSPILKLLGVKKLIDDITDAMKAKLDLDTLRKSLDEKVDQVVQKLDPILKLLEEKFEKGIQDFRTDPTRVVINVIMQAMKKKDPSRMFRATIHVPAGISIHHEESLTQISETEIALPPAPTTLFKRVETDATYVTRTQTELDTFAASPPSDTLTAPYLGYAYYSNPSDPVPVPVPTPMLIRIVQRPILLKQVQARTRPIPQVSSATSSNGEPLELITKIKSGGLSPKFDAFVDQYPSLAGRVQTAKDRLAGIYIAAQQLDDDMATYDSETGNFCSHFASMLSGFDPLLNTAIVALNEPLGYEPTLTPIVAKLAKTASFPTDIADRINATFAALKNVKQSLEDFKTLKAQAQTNLGTGPKTSFNQVGDYYNNYHKQVADICNSAHYSKLFGSSITTLGSFVAAVKDHLDSLDRWFIFLNEVVVSIINKQSKLSATAKATMFANIDSLFGFLLPIINNEIKKIQKVPDEVAKLYNYLSSMYKDVQIFFQASADVSQNCSALEAKLIAADRVATLCTSLNTGMLQLDTVLTTLDPSQTIDLSLSTIPIDNTIKSINSLMSSHFKLEDVQTNMAKVADSLSKVNITTHLATLDQELSLLVALLQIKEQNAKDVFMTDSDAVVNAPNPLLDTANANLLDKITTEAATIIT